VTPRAGAALRFLAIALDALCAGDPIWGPPLLFRSAGVWCGFQGLPFYDDDAGACHYLAAGQGRLVANRLAIVNRALHSTGSTKRSRGFFGFSIIDRRSGRGHDFLSRRLSAMVVERIVRALRRGSGNRRRSITNCVLCFEGFDTPPFFNEDLQPRLSLLCRDYSRWRRSEIRQDC